MQGIIFDLDGTLLDSVQDIGESINTVLKEHEFPTHAIDAYFTFVGDGALKAIERALPEPVRSQALIEQLFAEFKKVYDLNWNNNSKLYPGIAELLDGLTERKIPMAVLSNKPHGFTQRYVKSLFDAWTFDPIFGFREGIPKKPDPAGALEILQQWNIAGSECLYVGDTDVDMKTGQAAGLFPIGVSWGFRPLEELQNNGALATVQHPTQILEFF